MSGNLSVSMTIDPKSDVNNLGWMQDAQGQAVALVWLDQVTPEQIGWMRENGCQLTCKDVFVRGVVVDDAKFPDAVLRLKDISFESHAAGAPAVKAAPVAADVEVQPGSGKPLLPPGAVPTEHGATGFVVIPEPAQASGEGKSTWDAMKQRSDTMRKRDYNLEQGVIPGPERPANFETYYRSVRDTKLANVFAASPWNAGQNSWPHVALVVEAGPRHGDSFLYKQPGDKLDDACWRLRAKLWTGPRASQDIATFNACLSEMRFNVAYTDVAFWGKTPKISMSDHTTGAERTMGPNPPYIPVPKLQFSDGANTDTVMLGTLLLDMGFDSGMPDGRVWVIDGTKP
jgi:hypothetical protein